MQDDRKSKAQLTAELQVLRRQVAEMTGAPAERREVEEELLKFKLGLERSGEAVFITALDGTIVYVNPAFEKVYGYSEEEALGKTPRILKSGVLPEEAYARFWGMLLAKEVVAGEIINRTKDGRLINIENSANPILNHDGNILGFLAIQRDITERRQAERERQQAEDALRESERRYRELADSLPETLFETDLSARLTFVNKAAIDLFLYSEEEFEAGFNVLDGLVAEDRDRARSNIARVLAGQPPEPHEYMVVRKDGSTFPAVIYSNRIVRDGVPVGLRGLLMDITKRKQLEEELRRAQRLEIAGRMASQVAHDFNNLLGPMVGYPELIRAQLPEGHPALRYCEAMLDAADLMAGINENLMALGRRGLLEETPTDVNEVVEQSVEQMAGRPESLTVDLDLSPDLLPVMGSPSQLLRVVANLLSNAREAMEDVGLLSVKTENVYVDVPVGRHDRIEVGEYVRLTVSDSGCGIPAEDRDKIFDAFFTAKKKKTKKRGAGLGLSIVQSIVRDHRGYLDLESEVGGGSAFSVYLPVCQEAVREKVGGTAPRGHETLLVVDDDQLQREVARELLCRLGYRVEVAASGEQAVSYLRDHSVDLLVLDMVMPGGIDGAETYRRVLEMRPGQRAIIASGFAESERVREAQALGAGSYLRKPVKLETLAQAVRQELEPGSGRAGGKGPLTKVRKQRNDR